jgi:hypothetical protein
LSNHEPAKSFGAVRFALDRLVAPFRRPRSQCGWQELASPKGGAPVFVVIHGTWGRSSDWLAADSTLVGRLLTAWPGAGLCRFSWSGLNGTTHRTVSAEVLANHLNTAIASYGDSHPVIAIAHSHGGNVLAWASTAIEPPLHAAVYLGAPFIQILEESPGEFAALAWAMAPIALLIVARIVSLSLDQEFLLGPLAIAIGCTVWGLGRLASRLAASLRAVACAPRRVTHELAAFVVGDEASTALGLMFAARVVAYAVAALAILALLFDLASNPASPVTSVTDGIVKPLLVLAFGGVLLYTVLCAAAFGPMHALLTATNTVTVTTSPTGLVDCLTIEWSRSDHLRHFQVYLSASSCDLIVAWVRQRLSLPANAMALAVGDYKRSRIEEIEAIRRQASEQEARIYAQRREDRDDAPFF